MINPEDLFKQIGDFQSKINKTISHLCLLKENDGSTCIVNRNLISSVIASEEQKSSIIKLGAGGELYVQLTVPQIYEQLEKATS